MIGENIVKNGEISLDEKTANRSGSFNAKVFGVISPKINNKTVTITVIVGMTMARFVISMYLKKSIIIVVPNAEHATLQKLLPIKIAVINLDGFSSNRSTSSVCFGFSFSI